MSLTQNILVATDFSKSADLALNAASILAGQNGAKVTIVHVVEANRYAPLVEDPDSGELVVKQDIREELHEDLLRLRKEQFSGVPEVKTTLVVSKSAADGICHYAEKEEVDMIVLATHGRTGLKHMLIGSVAEKVVRHAPCPVLTLRSRFDE